jgi:GAF domain-containing protein
MLAAPDGRLQVMAASSETTRLLELLELQSEEGPCLDCYRTGESVINQDLLTIDGRWPRFAARTIEAGFHTVHAFPMRLRGTTIGALNLFHVATIQLHEAQVVAAQAFADVATIAILQHRAAVEAQILNEQLQVAFNSRVLIEQAKGVAAERDGVDTRRAYKTSSTKTPTTTHPPIEPNRSHRHPR